MASLVQAAPPSAPSRGDAFLGRWRYSLRGVALQCAQPDENGQVPTLSPDADAVIVRAADGRLVLKQEDFACAAPLELSADGTRLSVPAGNLCGTPQLGIRHHELVLTRTGDAVRIREKATMQLGRFACDYSVEAPLQPEGGQRVADVEAPSESPDALEASEEAAEQAVEGALVVLADGLFAEAFGGLGEAFHRQHPEVQPSLRFGYGAELRQQLASGAQHVFVGADVRRSPQVSEVGGAFAGSELVVVVPSSNPGKLRSFWDLRWTKKVALLGPETLGGEHARVLLRKAAPRLGKRFSPTLQGLLGSGGESDPQALLERVVAGKVDAALVYRSEALKAGKQVRILGIPRQLGSVIRHETGRLAAGAQEARAAEWEALLRSREGQKLLKRQGFLTLEELKKVKVTAQLPASPPPVASDDAGL